MIRYNIENLNWYRKKELNTCILFFLFFSHESIGVGTYMMNLPIGRYLPLFGVGVVRFAPLEKLSSEQFLDLE